MEEIKGIILNGVQYGLEDETTLSVAQDALKQAETNANDITTAEANITTAQATADEAKTAASTAQAAADEAKATASAAQAAADEKQGFFGKVITVTLPASGSYIIPNATVAELFGKSSITELNNKDFAVIFEPIAELIITNLYAKHFSVADGVISVQNLSFFTEFNVGVDTSGILLKNNTSYQEKLFVVPVYLSE